MSLPLRDALLHALDRPLASRLNIRAELPDLVLVLGVVFPFIPTRIAPELSKQPRGHDLCLVHGLAPITIWTHVNRVFLAIELAHEARLEVLDARADRDPIWPRLEYVRGANLDAAVATRATLSNDQFKHGWVPFSSRFGSDPDFVETTDQQTSTLVGLLLGDILSLVHAATLVASERGRVAKASGGHDAAVSRAVTASVPVA